MTVWSLRERRRLRQSFDASSSTRRNSTSEGLGRIVTSRLAVSPLGHAMIDSGERRARSNRIWMVDPTPAGREGESQSNSPVRLVGPTVRRVQETSDRRGIWCLGYQWPLTRSKSPACSGLDSRREVRPGRPINTYSLYETAVVGAIRVLWRIAPHGPAARREQRPAVPDGSRLSRLRAERCHLSP